MKYINQLRYPQIEYPTDLDTPDSIWHHGNVKKAGCGLCSICMVIDRLTLKSLSIRDCIAIAENVQANRKIGTNMKILGPVIAEMYNLEYETSDDSKDLKACLQAGGCAIANVGGDREGYTGIFSHGGHYITIISYDNEKYTILDPSWKKDKFLEPEKNHVIEQDGYFVKCKAEVLDKETENRTPGYYLFKRR